MNIKVIGYCEYCDEMLDDWLQHHETQKHQTRVRKAVDVEKVNSSTEKDRTDLKAAAKDVNLDPWHFVSPEIKQATETKVPASKRYGE